MVRMKTFLVWCLIALQVWVPIAFEWRGAIAFADDVVKNAGEGQTFGNTVLRNQFTTIRNTTLVDQHVDGNSTTDFGNGQARINLQEFGLGGDANQARQTLSNAYNNPATLNDDARQARRDMQERGCRNTTFAHERTSTVLTVTPLRRTLVVYPDGRTENQDTPDTSFLGIVNVKYPTIGYMRSWYQIVQAPEVGSPGLVLHYSATPFTVPNDGSFFTFNHQVIGSAGNPVVVDYGNREDGYATETLVYANGGPIQVKADLYRVNKAFFPQPSAGCPLDPASCIVSGVNFCGSPGLGVLDVFRPGQRHKDNAMSTLLSAVSGIQYDETDADLSATVNRGTQVLNGSDPVFTELFTGCTETANFTTNTVTVRNTQIKTCSMPLVDLQLTCNGTRGTHFVYLQESTVLTASFFQRIQVPIIDPITGQQAKDKNGNLVFTEQDIPAVYSGSVDIGFPTFGGANSWSTSPDASGYYVSYSASPFTLNTSEHFPYDVTVLSDGGASSTVSSYGSKSDNWKLVGTASVSGASQLRVNAKLYQVVSNSIVGCDDYLRHAADGFCQAEMQCTENRGPCTTLDGVSFCEGSGPASGIVELLTPWGISDSAQPGGELGNGVVGGGAKTFLPRMCWKGTGTRMNCGQSVTGALSCYNDINGNQICGSVTGDGFADNFGEAPQYLDDCASPNNSLFGNSACRLVSTNTCTEGGAGLFSGTCYNRTVVYDCGTVTEVQVPGGVSYSQSCGSPIRCLGTECHNPKGETNGDFGKAVTAATVVDMAARDMVCAEDGQRPTSVGQAQCTPLIFSGENYTCKVPIGSGIGLTPNCCKQSDAAAAGGPNAIRYLQLVFYTYKMGTDKAMMSALAQVPGMSGFAQGFYSSTGGVQTAIDGAIASTKSFLMDGVSTAAKQFGFEFTTPTAQPVVKDFILSDGSALNAGLSQAQMTSYNNFLIENGMEDLAQDLFVEQGGELALSETGEQVFQTLQGVQTFFMVYSIVKILGHIIFQCEEKELKLGVQKNQRSCHYVGSYCAKKAFGTGCIERRESYCCYKTPLARIVAEQIRTKSPQVAGDYGSAKNPQCGGFTTTQLASFDWSLLDTSEWVSLLQDAGLIPDSTDTANTMYGLNSSRAALETGHQASNEINIQNQTIQRYSSLVETYSTRRTDLASQPVCYGSATEMPWYQPAPTSRSFELDTDMGSEVPINTAKTFDINVNVRGVPSKFLLTAYRVDNYGQLWINGVKVFENTIYGNSDMRGGRVENERFYDSAGNDLGPLYDDGCNPGCRGLTPNLDITSYFQDGANVITLVCANQLNIGPCAIKILGESEEAPVLTNGCIAPDGSETN